MADNSLRVLVYGANGVQGRAVVQQLLKAGHRVRGISRQAVQTTAITSGSVGKQDIELVQGDLGDMESLVRASREIDAVFLLTPGLHTATGKGGQYGRNAIDAAKAAGVEYLVFNTSTRIHAVPGFEAKRQVEDHLRSSGLRYVILRPTFYMENFLIPGTAAGIINQGVVAFLNPRDLRASWISVDDMAAFAVAALERPDLSGQSFNIGGPEILDGNAIAERFSTAIGRPLAYVEVSPDVFEQQMAGFVGTEVAQNVANTYRWMYNNVDTDLFTADMASIVEQLPVELTPLAEWVRRYDWTALAQAV